MQFLTNILFSFKLRKLFLFAILIYTISQGTAQTIHAEFSAPVTSGCSPLEVDFLNLSSPDSGISCSWILGNGNTSNVPNPFAIYTQPGNYSITLIITNGTQTDTITKHDFIKVFKPAIANFNAISLTNGCVPLDIQFINQSIPGDAPIAYSNIDFGDGSNTDSVTINHIYNISGIFSVSLTITDTNGCPANLIRQNYIESYKPEANFTTPQTTSCSGTLNAAFTNQSIADSTLSYLWNFGDGNFSTEENPIHLFQGGNHTISLLVTDEHGCSDTATKTNYIRVTELTSMFSVNRDTGCTREILHFINTSSVANYFSWDFGDGTTSDLQRPMHSYAAPGNYSVKLIVAKNEQCKDSSVKNINIEYIKANFSLTPRYGCEFPFYSNFLDMSINATQWNWRFGNKDRSEQKNPTDSIMFLTNTNFRQVFADSLIAISPYGCRDTMILDSSRVFVLPKLDFSPNMDFIQGCIPYTVNITNNCSYNSSVDSIIEWKWHLGNNQEFSDKNFNYIFTEQGIHFLKFTLKTALGCSSEKSTFIKTGVPLAVNFTLASNDSVCASDSVKFINLTPYQGARDCMWLFGDGSISLDENPTIYFRDTGYIHITLMVSNNGCMIAANKDHLLYIKGPFSSFVETHNCSQPLSVKYTPLIKGATNFYWDFGDSTGHVIDTGIINHTFSQRGNYNVKLFTQNSNTNCSYSNNQITHITTVYADFDVSSKIGCIGDTVTLDGSHSLDAGFDEFLNKYNWYFGDIDLYQATTEGNIHAYSTRGNHMVKLTVKDVYGCPSTKIKYVKIYNPQINFTANYQQGCIPVDFNFTNQTINDTTSTNILWNFGDSSTSVLNNPAHPYLNFGNYDVSLKVTNILNCSSTLVKPEFIKAIKPDASFSSDNNNRCIGDSIHFFDISQSDINTYLWNFGDGVFSTEETPVHVFPDTGYYNVSLRIKDMHGCDTTYTIPNFINIQKAPITNFTADIFSSSCYPTRVSFTDNSVSAYLGGWKWNFGDLESASGLENPEHIFYRPGIYDVSLISFTTNGCSDTLTKKEYLNIHGPWAKIISADTVCRNENTVLTISEKINVYSFKWDVGNGNVSYSDSVITEYTNFGNVYPSLLLFADSNHTCDKIISDTLLILQTIADFDINNNHFNDCTPFEINGQSISVNGDSVKWYLNQNLISDQHTWHSTISAPADYNVTIKIKSNFGCKDSITKNVTVYPLPEIKTSVDTMICRGTSASLLAKGGIYYTWSPSQNLTSNQIFNPLASPDSSIQYEVTGTDIHNCKNKASVKVRVYQKPKMRLRDTIIVIGETVTINATHPELSSYSWNPSSSVSCSNCPIINARPTESTTYILTATDSNNCFVLDYPIQIDLMRKYSVDVPEIFTPNGDGSNDKIFVRGWGIMDLITFKIFNRFGEMVFETNDLATGWDGSYKGEQQNTESFSYIVQVRSFDNNVLSKKGYIKLIR